MPVEYEYNHDPFFSDSGPQSRPASVAIAPDALDPAANAQFDSLPPPEGNAPPASDRRPSFNSRRSSGVVYRRLEHTFDPQEADDGDLPEDFRTPEPETESRNKPAVVLATNAATGLRRMSAAVLTQALVGLAPDTPGLPSYADIPPNNVGSLRSGTAGFARLFDTGASPLEPALTTELRERLYEVPDVNGNYPDRIGPPNRHNDDTTSEKDVRQRALRMKLGPMQSRRQFILRLAKALMSFGAPSHRIESQLNAACDKLKVEARLAYLPNIIIVTFSDDVSHTDEFHFVRSSGSRISLTFLRMIHDIYRHVLHHECKPEEGTRRLVTLLRSRPIYSLGLRCIFSLVSSAVICALSFNGSFVDMWVSGVLASVTQYLGLTLAAKSTIYGNVYEISAAMFVSFAARALSSVPGRLFCYSSISSGGVVPLLPGYIILTSALELTQRSIVTGAVRLVYAIIYTFFLGFSMTIGSDLFLLVYPAGRVLMHQDSNAIGLNYLHGAFTAHPSTNGAMPVNYTGTFGFSNSTLVAAVAKTCFRGPDWPWYLLPSVHWPWWRFLLLVPTYALAISLSNLQSFKSFRIIVMVFFACVAYLVNFYAHHLVGPQIDVASALGALALGMLGNLQSRVFGGTAFTSMVPGVLFLVPSGLAQGGGLAGSSSSGHINDSFALGMRMINVAIGVTIGLSVSQTIVYTVGNRKSAGHMAF